MASKGYIEALLNPLPSDQRRVLLPAFEHVLDTWKLGTSDKAANASWYKFTSTTAATANEEFSIEHGLNQIPTWVIPVLDLGYLNSQLVNLTVTKAPDVRRIYLSSPSTGAAFTIMLEIT